MATLEKRSTVYFAPEIHRALRIRAAELDVSISDLINDAIRFSLADEEGDLAARIKKRENRKDKRYLSLAEAYRRADK